MVTTPPNNPSIPSVKLAALENPEKARSMNNPYINLISILKNITLLNSYKFAIKKCVFRT